MSKFYFDILITVIHSNVNHKKWLFSKVYLVEFFNVVLSFCRLAISATPFLVVFDQTHYGYST